LQKKVPKCKEATNGAMLMKTEKPDKPPAQINEGEDVVTIKTKIKRTKQGTDTAITEAKIMITELLPLQMM
jgi:hypothetical protein